MNKVCQCVQGGFVLLFVISIVASYAGISDKNITVMTLVWIALLGIALMLCFTVLYGFLKKREVQLAKPGAKWIPVGILLGMLVGQILFAAILHGPPRADLSYVDTAARSFSQSWNPVDLYVNLDEKQQNYFARYTNNDAILVILSVVYKISQTVLGRMSYLVPCLLNACGLNLSALLIYLIAKRMYQDNATPLFCLVLAACFPLFYTYVPFYYTDAMSMPFCLLSVYLFLRGMDAASTRATVVQLALCGISLTIGFKIKGSVIILLPAFLLYLLIFCKRTNWKAHLRAVCALAVSFVLTLAACGVLISSLGIAPEAERAEYEFPLTHWVMMALNGKGAYNEADFFLTRDSGDYEAKQQMNIEQIRTRISELGVGGLLHHELVKIAWTWSDGTYMAAYYLKYVPDSTLKDVICHSRRLQLYCEAYQVMLLVMICVSFFHGARQKQPECTLLLRIVLMGVFFFFLLWESKSRYLSNFTPIMLLLCAGSVRVISQKLSSRKTKRVHAVKGIRPETTMKDLVDFSSQFIES